jgi:hypothetical protein
VTNLYGSRTIFSGATVLGSAYGDYSFIQTSGTDYGVYAHVDNNATDYAGYFVGRSSFGNDSAVGRYLMPAADGTANQVMATNGSGQLSFVDIPSNDAWYEEGTTNAPNAITDNIYTQGRVGIGDSTPDAVLDMEYNGILDEGMSINYLHANSGATGAALDILARSGDAGIIRGSSITIDNSASASAATGIYISNSAQASDNYGYVTQMTGSGNSNTGLLSQVSGSGNFNYGIRAFATNATTNWAGFFGAPATPGSGNVYVQDRLRADGIIQYLDGNQAAGRVLASNATGEASWVNPTAIFTDTDDQTVDTFALVGNNIGISLEDDGQPIQIVDLSNVNFNVSNFALAKMTMSAAQAFTGPAWTKQNFDTVSFDTGSNFNTMNDRFEVSEDGYYRIKATSRTSASNATTNQFGVAVRINGAAVKQNIFSHHGTGVIARDIETVEYLNSGDYIEIFFYTESNVGLGSSSLYSSFEVERIR